MFFDTLIFIFHSIDLPNLKKQPFIYMTRKKAQRLRRGEKNLYVLNHECFRFAAILKSKFRGKKHIAYGRINIGIGVLFAVFGQIYQTGANAYDFF